MTPMFPQRCTTDKKDLLCADDQQIFTSQVTFQSSSCNSSEPTRQGFSSVFFAKFLSQWGERDQVNVQYKVKKLKLLCKFVIIIDVVKTIHRWGLDFSILKYVWDLKCFKWQNDNHVQGVNHCMRASTTPELILGQPAREDREPRSCQLGTYDIMNEIAWKCGHQKLELKED